MKIEDWRIRIDELNDEIISLLNKRATYATEIGKIKKQQGLPVFDSAREDYEGPLDSGVGQEYL